MTILTDRQIKIVMGGGIMPYHPTKQCHDPFGKPLASYGQEAFGYTVRLAQHFKVLTAKPYGVLDPHALNEAVYEEVEVPYLFVQPGHCVLGCTVEYIQMPEDVVGIVLGKSTYARLGLVVNATPLEPGWRGQITLELSNTNRLPIKVYADEGIAQILFFKGDMPKGSYEGNYQEQHGVTLAQVGEPL